MTTDTRHDRNGLAQVDLDGTWNLGDGLGPLNDILSRTINFDLFYAKLNKK
jgi:hypothetical protein